MNYNEAYNRIGSYFNSYHTGDFIESVKLFNEKVRVTNIFAGYINQHMINALYDFKKQLDHRVNLLLNI